MLAVINILEKKIQFFDSMGGHDKLSLVSKPCLKLSLLYLDWSHYVIRGPTTIFYTDILTRLMHDILPNNRSLFYLAVMSLNK